MARNPTISEAKRGFHAVNGQALPRPPKYDPAVLEHLITEDGKPRDSISIEMQQRLLVASLQGQWRPGRPFFVTSNVGMFHVPKNPAFVPDVMLSMDVQWPWDPRESLLAKVNTSYYEWVVGKPLDVAIEIVSDRRGGEDGRKKIAYHGMNIPYYVIFDPRRRINNTVLRAFVRGETAYKRLKTAWLPDVGLGLRLWTGAFEGKKGKWLRWYDADGRLVPTDEEFVAEEKQRALVAAQRADQADQRAAKTARENERLRAQLRSLGIDPQV